MCLCVILNLILSYTTVRMDVFCKPFPVAVPSPHTQVARHARRSLVAREKHPVGAVIPQDAKELGEAIILAQVEADNLHGFGHSPANPEPE